MLQVTDKTASEIDNKNSPKNNKLYPVAPSDKTSVWHKQNNKVVITLLLGKIIHPFGIGLRDNRSSDPITIKNYDEQISSRNSAKNELLFSICAELLQYYMLQID